MLKISKLLTVDTLFTAFTRNCESDFLFTGERHNYWEFLYVVNGCVGVAVEDRVYELTGGKIIFYYPMEFHSIWSANGTSPDIIIFSFSMSGNNLKRLTQGVFDIGEYEHELLTTALSYANHCMEFDDEVKNQLTSNKLEEMMLRLLENQVPATAQKKTLGTENYKMIIRLMEENVDKNLSSEQLAELCGLSLSNLKKIFKKYSGMGVMKYYNNLRILKAMDLIKDGKSMSEISDMLNYSSQNYFTEAFKRHCGMTPTKHRQFCQQDYL